MRPDHDSRSVSTPARFVIVAATLGSLLLSALPAAAQPPGADHRRGQAALDRLGARLPAVAAQHNMAPARLRELFLSDPYLAVDEADNLLFIDEFTPDDAPGTPGAVGGAEATALALQPLTATFRLHSLPDAAKVIYLDFDGHTTSATAWSGGATIVSAPYTIDGDSAFSPTELERIQYIWQRVAEDFLPYGVDVTTEDPGVEALRRFGTGDVEWGQRVVISPTNWYSTEAGGVAYIGSFSWSSDTPCFAFSAQLGTGNEKYTAEAISHEAGHTLGLYHDGVTGGSAYYSGHSGWAPIMGVGYYQSLVQWSRGEYPAANNTEGDLAIMTGYGFTVRSDDHGDTAIDATPLIVANATNVGGGGIIESLTDRDAFSFLTGAGTISLSVVGAARSANLDIKAELYDSTGTSVASDNPSASMNAAISLAVPAGTYALIVEGVGKGDVVTGYSDYGSLGEYSISGTIVNPGVMQPPVAVAAATPTSGTAPLAVAFGGGGSHDPDGTINAYAWSFGDTGSAITSTASHTYTLKGVYTAILTTTDNDGLRDTDSVVITVTDPPAAAVMHVGDLDGTRSATRKSWSAKVTIAVHDASHKPVAGAVVGGSWSPGGSASCTTGTKGTCTVSINGLALPVYERDLHDRRRREDGVGVRRR